MRDLLQSIDARERSVGMTTSVETLINRSQQFYDKHGFSVQGMSNRIADVIAAAPAESRLTEESILLGFAAGTRPIIHCRVPALLEEYLKIKRRYGTASEQHLYASMTASALVKVSGSAGGRHAMMP